jgi:PAS domain S-box
MKRDEVRERLSQTVGVTKAEAIISDAESALGYAEQDSYTDLEVRSLCEQIKERNEGYVGEVASQLHVRAQANQRFQTLLENVPNPTVIVDFEEREPVIRSVNEAFKNVFKFDTDTAVGESLNDLVVPDTEQVPFEVWSRADGEGKQEVSRLTAAGNERTFLVRRAMATRSNGGVEGFAVYTDITERKRREQEQRMLKEVFSRVFRHNVRNELTVARGQLEIIEAKTDVEDIIQRATTAKTSTDRLLNHTEKARQIERLIDMDPSIVEQSVQSLVDSAVKQCQQEYDGLTVTTSIDDTLVQVVEGFEIVIKNAVENAIEHNPRPVEVDLSTDVGPDMAKLSVSDNGTGIPTDEIAVLEEEKETELSHGSGVGLWLMKWYVDRSGGTIDIISNGTGTQVDLTLNRAVVNT